MCFYFMYSSAGVFFKFDFTCSHSMDGQKDQRWGGHCSHKNTNSPENWQRFLFCTVQETKNLAFATSDTLIFYSVIKH